MHSVFLFNFALKLGFTGCNSCGCDSAMNSSQMKQNRAAQNILINSNTTSDNQFPMISILDDNTKQVVLNMSDDLSPKINLIITDKPPIRRVTTDDRIIHEQSERLMVISCAHSLKTLETTMKLNYFITEDLNSDSDSSLEYRTNPLMSPNVYKHDSNNLWELTDIEDLHKEMSKEMEELQKSNNIFVPSKTEHSNLFCNGDNKYWDKSCIDEQRKEMQRQMFHLAQMEKNIRT